MINRLFKVAIIGAGIGKEHLNAFNTQLDRFSVKYICDLDVDKAKRLISNNNTKITEDYEEVLNDDEIDEIFQRTSSEQVNTMLDLAESAGIDGIVCSPHELKLVKKRGTLLSITPGIRLQDSNDDQKRVMTPKEAINLGADFLVIGRPITGAENIGEALDEIFQNIS